MPEGFWISAVVAEEWGLWPASSDWLRHPYTRRISVRKRSIALAQTRKSTDATSSQEAAHCSNPGQAIPSTQFSTMSREWLKRLREFRRGSQMFHARQVQYGADLVCQVIRECPVHLRPRGRLFFPVISLSNGERILNIAGETFKSVTKIAHEEWPRPKDMAPHAALIKRLQQDGKIQITQKFGMIIFSTNIYVAHNDEGRIS